MKLIVFILFFIVAFIYLIERGELDSKQAIKYMIVLWPILVTIATFRSQSMPDYENYELFFKSGSARFEIGFIVITEWIKELGGNLYIFFAFFAGISIALKLIAINKMTKIVLGAVLVYISNIYILHDLIQMRCAVASGILLLTVYLKANKKWFWCVVSFAIAFLFHYSSIAFLFFLFLNTKTNYKAFYAGLIFFSYFIAILDLSIGSLVAYIPLEFVQTALAMYQDNIFEEVDIFNALQMLRVLLCFYLLYFADRLKRYNQYSVLLIKIYAISLSCLVAFSDLPVLAFRISELLLVVECVAAPLIYYTLRGPELLRKLPLVLLTTVMLVLNVTKAALVV